MEQQNDVINVHMLAQFFNKAAANTSEDKSTFVKYQKLWKEASIKLVCFPFQIVLNDV